MRTSLGSLAAFGLVLLASGGVAQERPAPVVDEIRLPELRRELLDRAVRDQAIRNEVIQSGAEHPEPALLERQRKIDQENTARVREIVREHGWPGIALVGRDGSHAAWLFVQHSKFDFQEEMLPLVKAAYLAGDLPGSCYALLLDRVLVHQGKPQIYGSQGKWQNGVLGLQPIEDEAHVDLRRAEVGLGPLADYLKNLRAMYQPKGPTAAASPVRNNPSRPPLPTEDYARLLELERRIATAAAEPTSADGDGQAEKRRRDDLSFLHQQLAWARSVVGDDTGALAATRQSMEIQRNGAIPATLAGVEQARATLQEYRALDAVAAIVAAARDRQIVILNEAHHVGRHRGFALRLAQELRSLGFEYLACEAFAPNLDSAALRQRGYPRIADGALLREPLFSDFVRQSLRLGYVPVAYEYLSSGTRPENPADSINTREAAQAANLMERIFKTKPDARVLIYVGYSHLLKNPQPRGGDGERRIEWLAARLKALTGIDPLTIDQTTMTDPDPGSAASVFLQELYAGDTKAGAALVLRRDADARFLVLGPYANDADIQVFHRPTARCDGRPDWLSLGGYRQPREVPAQLRPATGRRLVQAFFAGETTGAVAVDQFLISAGDSTPPAFMLPAGDFRFAFVDAPAPGNTEPTATRTATAAAPRVETGEYFYDVAMPGPPFSVVATRDGNWVFVSLAGMRAGKPLGLALLRRADDRFVLERTVPTPSLTQGLVLTHDGKTLIAAADSAVLLLDVDRMISGRGDPLTAKFGYDDEAGTVYANITADDATLFLSDERAARVTVVDLQRVRADGFTSAAILGRIPVGRAPIALTFSPDQRWLYTTNQVASREWGWPNTISREGQPRDGAPLVPEGAVVVIDVERARRDPEHAVVARVPAGGSPVRLALSPTGDRAYVTARNSNALLVFDTARLVAGDPAARLATIPVGSSPVGVLVAKQGQRILVTNSNRFGSDAAANSSIALIDSTKVSAGAAAVIGTLAAGAFPREWHLMPDGRTALLTNFRSGTLRVIDLTRVPGW